MRRVYPDIEPGNSRYGNRRRLRILSPLPGRQARTTGTQWQPGDVPNEAHAAPATGPDRPPDAATAADDPPAAVDRAAAGAGTTPGAGAQSAARAGSARNRVRGRRRDGGQLRRERKRVVG